MWPQESRSTRPSGSASTGALYPPPRGKCGLTGMIGPQVLPPSVDRWITVFMSPALNAQLPSGAHRKLTRAADGPSSQVTYTVPALLAAMSSRSPQLPFLAGSSAETCGKLAPWLGEASTTG